ncbi:MAG TPA: glucose dehydrogenase [Cryomorphaceae bacterium]|nr:glucose dehydrogenase [Owenweeksia sp.]HBF19684.1 glucose dehydrogenase [Cryomorphaceae bacterium]
MRWLLLFLLTYYSLSTPAQIILDSTTVTVSEVARNLDTPWEILWGPDDHIWFTERRGTVNRLDPDNGTLQILITINEVQEQGESGLLGMALHPDFANPDSQFVYLVYTYNAPALTEKLVRYTYQGNTLQNPVVLLDNIPANNNHDGSRLVVTANRKLLMTTGDAENTSSSQNLNSLAGKVLRLNLDGSVPADNPYPNSYIWSIGHRNPQGLVEAPNGIIYSSEHGPSNDDEINSITKDGHYGWPDVEGFCNLPQEVSFCTNNNVTEPLFAWTPTLAVAGLDYYNHPSIPEWQNSLLLVTLKERDLRVLELDASGQDIVQTHTFLNNQYGRLRDVCVSPDGDIYLSTSNRDGRNNNPAAHDDRILKLTNANFFSRPAQKAVSVTIYPNPVQDILHINTGEKGYIRIYDARGQLRLYQPLSPTLDVTDFTSGLYILIVETERGRSVQPLMKNQ